jgi:hypothetical protein
MQTKTIGNMLSVHTIVSFWFVHCGLCGLGTAQNEVEPPELPEVLVYLPTMGFARTPGSPAGNSGLDDLLRNSFPGQFFSEEEISAINQKFGSEDQRRFRRDVDRDLCCKTEIWFGTAPKTMTDASYKRKWEILQGKDMFQAFSRGDCYNKEPHHLCPDGGQCEQKFRMHTLWVSDEGAASMKYFVVPSHCAYEKKCRQLNAFLFYKIKKKMYTSACS